MSEIKQMRTEMSKFYSEEIKFLKKQEEYEKLLADIEEHKTRKFTMMQRAAQMFAQSTQAKAEAKAEQEAYEEYAEGVENGTIDPETGVAFEITPTNKPKERKLKTD